MKRPVQVVVLGTEHEVGELAALADSTFCLPSSKSKVDRSASWQEVTFCNHIRNTDHVGPNAFAVKRTTP